MFPSRLFAQECSGNRVEDLKEQCRDLLEDRIKLIVSGHNFTDASIKKFLEAAEPASKCLKGGYDLAKTLYVECNPYTPGTDLVSCASTLSDVPDTVKECKLAINLIEEAVKIRKQARFFYSRAEISFGDSGGDEIWEELQKCGESICYDLALASERLTRDGRDRSDRDLEKMQNLISNLEEVSNTLSSCVANQEKCEEVELFSIPKLEGKGEDAPEIIIP